MSRYVEYYEVKDIYAYPPPENYEYYAMAIDKDAHNKKNFDTSSRRIWRYDTKTGNVFYEKYDGWTVESAHSKFQVDMNEFQGITIIADPCPYSDHYNTSQRLKAKGIIK